VNPRTPNIDEVMKMSRM